MSTVLTVLLDRMDWRSRVARGTKKEILRVDDWSLAIQSEKTEALDRS